MYRCASPQHDGQGLETPDCIYISNSVNMALTQANAMARDAKTYDIPPDAQAAQDVSLPSDAAERKRVLNILAQRRYREWSSTTLVLCY